MNKEKFKEVLKHGFCNGAWCEENTTPAAEPHTCPFAEEIHGNTTLCNCCEDCVTQCGLEI